MIKEIIDTKIQGLMEDNIAHNVLSFKMNIATRDQFISELFGNKHYITREIQPGGGPQHPAIKQDTLIYNGFRVEVDNSLADGAVWTTVSGSVGK